MTGKHVDRLPGGLADKSEPGDFDPKQLRMGVEVEMEHTKDQSIAMEIAMDHLSEDPKYYTKLKKIHKEHTMTYFSDVLGQIHEQLAEANPPPVPAAAMTPRNKMLPTRRGTKPPPIPLKARAPSGEVSKEMDRMKGMTQLKALKSKNKAMGGKDMGKSNLPGVAGESFIFGTLVNDLRESIGIEEAELLKKVRSAIKSAMPKRENPNVARRVKNIKIARRMGDSGQSEPRLRRASGQ